MKTIISAAALVFSTNITLAQKLKTSEVPKPVLSSFDENFKGSTVKKWEKEKNGTYEAEFMENKTEKSATFNSTGALMETEVEITTGSLPAAVAAYVAKNYPGYKISEAAQITAPSGSQTYEAEIKKGKEEIDLMFDSNGKFLSKEIETHDEKDEKD